MPQATVEPWGETKIIGKRIPRVDAYERVSGAAIYPSDVMLPNMLYAAILRCPHPHAMVKKVDVGKALEMPGVRAVLTDADPEAHAVGWYQALTGVPRAPITIPLPDPKGRAITSRLFDPHCRYVGEEIAAVAAETPQQAWDAVRAIQVEYEVLPFVLDVEKALQPGAPALYPDGNLVNVSHTSNRGSVEQGFAEADVVLEETYANSVQIHSVIELHGSVTQWDGDHLTIWDTTQGAFRVQTEIAIGMNLPASNVRVIGKYCGAGFGSKLEPGKYSVIAALLAKKAARPVKLFISREEAFLSVGNRAGLHMRVKMGAKKDGTLTAIQMKSQTEIGAYPARAEQANQFTELYTCPNVSTDEKYVCINACRCRWMRAPATPGNWVSEQMIDDMAYKIGMDPVEFRVKNHSTFCQTENRPYFSNGGRECLIEGARMFGWKAARSRPKGNGPLLRGVGVASAEWASNDDGVGTVILKVYPDGTANLNTGATDIGTGWKTVAAMIVSEELGIPPNHVQIECADTATTQYSDNAGGEKTVHFDGAAVRTAALDIRDQLLGLAAQQLKVSVADLVYQDGVILVKGGGQKLAITELPQLKSRVGVAAMVRSSPIPSSGSYRVFGAMFAEVEVNTRTGEVRVLRMLAAQDSGRVMNLFTYENQVQGAMIWGVGMELTEERVMDGKSGKMLNANFHDYKIPTAKDAPWEMTVVPVETPYTANVIGAKGLGEICATNSPAVIANAFYHATGIRCTTTCLSPQRVLTLLAERQTRG